MASTADSFNDVLKVEDGAVQVLAEYGSHYYAGSPVALQLKQPAVDALTGTKLAGEIQLEPYGVPLLRQVRCKNEGVITT
ncbi:hypothetical protein ACFO9Q_18105 [Paenibacillus sp. GCM10023252]|uniref:hypothetical protein n=1 Tax=Paenibacillus sp. GCM10023252 TaxID=3252649 RepID=UPI0036150BF5